MQATNRAEPTGSNAHPTVKRRHSPGAADQPRRLQTGLANAIRKAGLPGMPALPRLARLTGWLALFGLLGLAGPAAAQAPSPVRIGVLADMTGLYSDIGGAGVIEAVRMAVEDYAKVDGKLKVEVISADTQNKPDIAVTLAREWIDTRGVDMLIDLPTSAIALAVANLASERNKLAMTTAAATSDLTGKACNENSIHWTYDTWAISQGTASAITRQGGKTWYFLTADYAFGQALERDASEAIKANGGKVVGSVRHPLDAKEFSSFLLQAQSSKAQIIGLANGGHDTINSLKAAAEFGIVQGGQKMAGMLLFISDIHGLGLEVAQGLMLTTAFYWDRNDQTREFGKRFAARNKGRIPSMTQAGAYSATLTYLKAVATLGSSADGKAVAKAIRDRGEFDDPLFGKTHVRIDGRAVHDMLLVEVKKPAESKAPYDYYRILSVIPPEQAFRPLKAGGCKLVAN